MHIGIIGFGLIGASLALAFKKGKPEVTINACDINPGHLKTAEDLNLGDAYFSDAAEAAAQSDIVIICTPVRSMGNVAKQIAPALKPGTIISDVGSVKSSVVKNVAPHIPEHCHFIPGHPVAGRETAGPAEGLAELFDKRTYVLTPLEGTDEAALQTLRDLIDATGAQLVEMDVKAHDKALGFTSHLPHIIAFSAMVESNRLSEKLDIDISQFNGGSYEDMTRVATADLAMWRDVFLTNADNIKGVVENTIEQMQHYLELMENQDIDGLETQIEKARQFKLEQLEKKKQRQASS